MSKALNIQLPIDPASSSQYARLQQHFATEFQPVIDDTLRRSKRFHSCAIYTNATSVQIVAVYDGDILSIAEYLRYTLFAAWQALFAVLLDAPNIDDYDAVYEYMMSHQQEPLSGYRFVRKADDASVRQIEKHFAPPLM